MSDTQQSSRSSAPTGIELPPFFAFLWAGIGDRLAMATGSDDAVWEPFQVQYLALVGEKQQTMIAASKTRQCGFSWLLAAEGIARAALYPGSLTNIVSINRDEAEEKIRYARMINECLHPMVRLSWTTDNREELEATNGSRIRSHACRPPRGRPGAHHRLDEVAHYQRPAEIYNAAVAGTLRAGSITCCSSPWVRGGFHYQVMEEPDNYPDFTRLWIPWWAVKGLCVDIETAQDVAPGLPTLERVERFGSDRLKRLFRNMPLDAFQVECELAYTDDNTAWLTWDEIMACTGPPEMDYTIASGLDEVRRALPSILSRRHAGPVYAGYDVARSHDLAVLSLLEHVGGRMNVFALLILPDCELGHQRDVLKEISPIIRSGVIDETGLGANLAEDMHKHNSHWHGLQFNFITKAQLATDIRKAFQERAILIPPDRDLQRDLHSVQRVVTAANNVVYEVSRDNVESSHADRFWSIALAIHALTRMQRTWEVTTITVGNHTPEGILAQIMANQNKQIIGTGRDKKDEPWPIDTNGNPIDPAQIRRMRRMFRPPGE